MTTRLYGECLNCNKVTCVDCPILEELRKKAGEVVGMVGDKRKEQDPNGVGQHDAGAKLDQGKNMSALVLGGFASALQDVSEVGTFGATKYSPNGWKEVDKGEQRYYDAAMRHILQDMSGEKIDTDSGLAHLAHAAWNLLAVIEFKKKES